MKVETRHNYSTLANSCQSGSAPKCFKINASAFHAQTSCLNSAAHSSIDFERCDLFRFTPQNIIFAPLIKRAKINFLSSSSVTVPFNNVPVVIQIKAEPDLPVNSGHNGVYYEYDEPLLACALCSFVSTHDFDSSVLFDNAGIQEICEVQEIPQIPTYMLLPLMYQLTARLGTLGNLDDLVLKTNAGREHPFHMLPILFALKKAQLDCKYI